MRFTYTGWIFDRTAHVHCTIIMNLTLPRIFFLQKFQKRPFWTTPQSINSISIKPNKFCYIYPITEARKSNKNTTHFRSDKFLPITTEYKPNFSMFYQFCCQKTHWHKKEKKIFALFLVFFRLFAYIGKISHFTLQFFFSFVWLVAGEIYNFLLKLFFLKLNGKKFFAVLIWKVFLTRKL